jgi:TRAP-type mannitol/chloroaromatic compound transport system permease small subunit
VLDRAVVALEAVVEVCGRLAAWVCVALVLVVAGNVFARHFFSTGTIWLQELEWHLISPIALLGMAYALKHGDQVRVDVFFDRMPRLGQRVVEVITGVLTLAFALIMLQLSLPFVMQAWATGEGSPNPGGIPFRFVLKGFIPLGFALLAIQGFAHTVKHLIAHPRPG